MVEEINSNQHTIIVYKTDILPDKEEMVRGILSRFDEVIEIAFDFEDCDNILRIVAKGDTSLEIGTQLVSKGFSCKELR